MLGDERAPNRQRRQPRCPRRLIARLDGPPRRRRSRLAEPRLGRRRYPHHDGIRRTAFLRGFSGGPKMVAPGLAGLETVLTLHDAARIAHPSARWGITEGNPVHDDVRAIAAATARRVRSRRDPRRRPADRGGLRRRIALDARGSVQEGQASRDAPAPGRFDVVVTSNAGYPLDQNLYQAVKGMSAAAQVVKDGGTISAPPNAVTASPTTVPTERSSSRCPHRRLAPVDPRPRQHRSRPMADPDPGSDPVSRARRDAHQLPSRRRAGRGPPHPDRRRRRHRRGSARVERRPRVRLARRAADHPIPCFRLTRRRP